MKEPKFPLTKYLPGMKGTSKYVAFMEIGAFSSFILALLGMFFMLVGYFIYCVLSGKIEM